MFKYSKLKGLNDGTCAIQYSSYIPTLVQITYPLEAETAFSRMDEAGREDLHTRTMYATTDHQSATT
jgi:hypothetical protein